MLWQIRLAERRLYNSFSIIAVFNYVVKPCNNTNMIPAIKLTGSATRFG